MRAVGVMSPGVVKMVEIPMPEFNEYECLVKMLACGFCNCTDVESVNNTHIHKDMPFPHVQGHEGVGDIVQLGSKVRNFTLGDRIIFPEGRIMPESGFSMCGCGHFAEYCIVKDVAAMEADGLSEDGYFSKWPYKLPVKLNHLDAAVFVPIRETLSGVRNFGIFKGARVLIVGDGPSGYGLALFAKLEGAERVIVAGHNDERLKHIKADTHADETINTHNTDLFDVIEDKSLDFFIDAVGSNEFLIRGSYKVVPGGKVGLYAGIRRDKRMLDLYEFANNVSLHKMYTPDGDREVNDEVVQMILDGRVDPKGFYSHVLPLAQFEKAMNMTLSREAFKVVLEF